MRDRRDRASVSPGEEGSFRVPDKKGRADLEIGQHLSAQGTNLYRESKSEIRLKAEHKHS